VIPFVNFCFFCGSINSYLQTAMKILILEPFFTGSHQAWAEGYQAHSQHEVMLLTQKGRHWKWRMFGGAVSLARQFLESDFEPNLIIASDMLDLSTFIALSRNKVKNIPITIYFHENQITYPWSPTDPDILRKRNQQYGFINYTSALAADAVFFNSTFHQESFLSSLPTFLKQFPDDRELQNVEKIKAKSQVLHLGMDLKRLDKFRSAEIKNEVPILLWNHRWEYDKNPEAFFKALFRLKEERIAFQLIVLGDQYKKVPSIFAEAKEKLKQEIIHFGYSDDFSAYAKCLWQADILPVTSNQDFFGGSVVEAIYCNCFPILAQRLAYPEHVEEKWKEKVFYETDENFYELLKNSILDFDLIAYSPALRDFVGRYDWSTLAPIYDKKFLDIIN